MSIKEYIHTQKSNLESIRKLPHFSILVSIVERLYSQAITLIPRDTPPRYGRFLLLCHKSFLSAASLIGQAQPDDAAPITRRAIEIARVCLASKVNGENASKWASYEKRLERWRKRQAGEKPSFLPPIKFDVKHPILEDLEKHLGILSDAYVHFTPEYYISQNWQDERNSDPPMVRLVYFISDQRTIERELILLTSVHAKILQIIDECLDGPFSSNRDWQYLLASLYKEGEKLSKKFER